MQNAINTYFPIQSLDKPAIKSPGVCYFLYAKHEDVLFWPMVNPLTGTFTEPIILKEGTTWYRCEVIDQDRDYKETQKSGDAGDFYEQSLNGFLPGDSLANLLSVSAMPDHWYVLVLKDRSGISKLLGNEDAGVKFTASYDSANGDGTRGRSLSFNFRSPRPAPIYLSAVTASGEIINPPWSGGGAPETDPTVPVWVKQISQTDINRWNTAFGWGDHAVTGYLSKVQADGLYAPITHTHALASLSDVGFVALQDRQLMRFNGVSGKWENFSTIPPYEVVIDATWAGRAFFIDSALLGKNYLTFREGILLTSKSIAPHPEGGIQFILEGDTLELGQILTFAIFI